MGDMTMRKPRYKLCYVVDYAPKNYRPGTCGQLLFDRYPGNPTHWLASDTHTFYVRKIDPEQRDT